MATDHGSSWNPTVVGPLDRCPRCWTPIGEELAYCQTCGKTSLVFNSLPVTSGERCFHHKDSPAEWTCCLCARPVCHECCDHVTTPLTTAGPLWWCRRCVHAARELEARFLVTLAGSNCCAKHRDIVKAFSCKTCGIPLCLSCTYFTAKGLFKERPVAGPYCLACFRMATPGRTREHWFSGHDMPAGFL
jgi:hypothetical protein